VPLSLGDEDADLSDLNVFYNKVRHLAPDFVINASCITRPANGRLTNVDKDRALLSNVLLPQTVARVCKMRNIPWGHVSSGTIYRGAKILYGRQWITEIDLDLREVRSLLDSEPDRVRGFSEIDEPNHCFVCPPCDFHSGTIALGERSITGVGNNYTWRPGMFFLEQHHHQNLLTNICARDAASEARAGEDWKSNDAQPYSLVSVTHLGEFVGACLDLAERHAPYGTYNIVNRGLVDTRKLGAHLRRSISTRAIVRLRPDEDGTQTGAHENFFLDASKLQGTGVSLRTSTAALQASIECLFNSRRSSRREGAVSNTLLKR